MKVLRWIAVLPAAIIAFALVYLLSKFLGHLFWPVDTTDVIWRSIYEFACNLLGGSAFVALGSLVAPEYKKTTSVVLATAGVIFCIISSCLQIFYIGVFDWWVIIGCIGCAVGCIVGSVQVHEDKDLD